MVMQEINRYADSEFRYADKSDEIAIENMVRDYGRQEEAKKRYLKGKKWFISNSQLFCWDWSLESGYWINSTN